MRKYAYVVFILFLVIGLAQCSYHLVQDFPLQNIQTLQLITDKPYAPLTKQLRYELQHRGVKITNDANFQLEIINMKWARKTQFISQNTRVRQYTLKYTLTFQVSEQHQPLFSKSQTITVKRNYFLDNNRILAARHEETRIEQEIRHYLIQQLLTRLAHLPQQNQSHTNET